MYQNWYKLTGKKRKPIVIADGDNFIWESVRNIDGSYNIVTIALANNKYNFYLWSEKTVKTANKLYKKEEFKKSLNMLKKYSFDVKAQETKDDRTGD